MRDAKYSGWGWRLTVYPIMGKKQFGSDRDILSKPSVDVVMCLLDSCITPNEDLVRRLATALASCAQLSTLGENGTRPLIGCLLGDLATIVL